MFQCEQQAGHYILNVITVFEGQPNDWMSNAILKHFFSCQKQHNLFKNVGVVLQSPCFCCGGFADSLKLAYVQSTWALKKEEFDQILECFKALQSPTQSSRRSSKHSILTRRSTNPASSCSPHTGSHEESGSIQSTKPWRCLRRSLFCGLCGDGSKN